MKSLPERIMEHAEATPEATPICPAALLHLGQRAAVGQALSRLARSGRLMRIRQGVYMRPIQTRFGRCAPGIEKSPQALTELWGETIVPNGGGAANWLVDAPFGHQLVFKGGTSLSKVWRAIRAVLGRHRHHLRHPRLRTGSGCRCRRRGAGQRRSVPALPNGSASGPARSSRKGLHAPGSWRGFVRRPSDST